MDRRNPSIATDGDCARKVSNASCLEHKLGQSSLKANYKDQVAEHESVQRYRFYISTNRRNSIRAVQGRHRVDETRPLYTAANAAPRGENDRGKHLHVIVHGVLTRDVNAPDDKKLLPHRLSPSFSLNRTPPLNPPPRSNPSPLHSRQQEMGKSLTGL